MASGTPNQVNGKSHQLNPGAKEFEPRNFVKDQNAVPAEPRAHNGYSPPLYVVNNNQLYGSAAVPPPPTMHYYPYRCPPIVPVVYPSVYGTPGTVFFMPRYQVPYAATLLPMKNGNGDYAYFYRVKHY